MTVSNDCDDVDTNDNLGNAQNTNGVLSSRIRVCASQEMITSHDNPHVLSIELRNHDKHTGDTPTRMGHSALNVIDPGGEACVRSKGLCMTADDINTHEASTAHSGFHGPTANQGTLVNVLG